jgi:tetratricopeptide (TPR) repeat protein
MPRVGVRNRWLVGAPFVVLILVSVILGSIHWRGALRVNKLQQATIAYERLEWPAAERHSREWLKEHRDDDDALRVLSRSLFRQGRDQSAMAIQTRLDNSRVTAEDCFLRGQALVRAGQREQGILLWRQTLGLDANHIETLVALEQVFFQMDLLSEAARAAERLSIQPGWQARSALLLGRIRAEQADPAGTAEALERALAHPEEWHGADDPNRVRKQLAHCLLQIAQPAEAREVLREMAATAQDPELCWLLCRCDLQEGKPTDDHISVLARSYRESNPMEPEPAPFVGEAQCAQCHKDTFLVQHQSRHARTFLRKEQFARVPLPERPIADPGNPLVTHAFSRRDDRIEVQTQFKNQVYQTIVDYAFGSGDRGLTLVGRDQEDRPFECRLSYYPDPGSWDVTTGQPTHTDQSLLYQGTRITADAVRRCLFCHTTHPHAIVTNSGAESSDKAIGCERCHGPGSHHLRAVASRSNDLAIARPTLARGPQLVELCSQCHSPRDKELKLAPESLESVRFQGTTFPLSRCFIESGNNLDCVTCHDPHRNAETSPAWYEAQCLDCHMAIGSSVSRPADGPVEREQKARRSCPIEPGRNCLDCHMPKVKNPSAHAQFTDHFIRIHRESDFKRDTPAS